MVTAGQFNTCALVPRFDGKVPSVSGQKGLEEVRAVGQQVGPMVQAYVACLEARKIKDGIRQAMAISSVGELQTCACQCFPVLFRAVPGP